MAAPVGKSKGHQGGARYRHKLLRDMADGRVAQLNGRPWIRRVRWDDGGMDSRSRGPSKVMAPTNLLQEMQDAGVATLAADGVWHLTDVGVKELAELDGEA